MILMECPLSLPLCRPPCGRPRRTAITRPARPSTKRPRPKTRPAITWPISGHGHCSLTSNTTRRSPRSASSRRTIPKAPGCGGPASPRPRRWSPRATSARAQAIYESEAKYLLSDARRQQSAEIYLEFADSCYQPARAGQSPDYNAARQFYAAVLDAGLNGPRRAEADFRMAICLQELGQFADAAKGFEEFVAKHAGDPRQPEARYRLGECLLAAGQPAEGERRGKSC